MLCEDGRCLPRATCCDPATQLGCRLTYMLPCCRKYLASVGECGPGNGRCGLRAPVVVATRCDAVRLASAVLMAVAEKSLDGQ